MVSRSDLQRYLPYRPSTLLAGGCLVAILAILVGGPPTLSTPRPPTYELFQDGVLSAYIELMRAIFQAQQSPTVLPMVETFLVQVVLPVSLGVLGLGVVGVVVARIRLEVDFEIGTVLCRSLIAGMLILMWPPFATAFLSATRVGVSEITHTTMLVGFILLLTLLTMHLFLILGFVLTPLFIAIWAFDVGPFRPLAQGSRIILRLVGLIAPLGVIIVFGVSQLV